MSKHVNGKEREKHEKGGYDTTTKESNAGRWRATGTDDIDLNDIEVLHWRTVLRPSPPAVEEREAIGPERRWYA